MTKDDIIGRIITHVHAEVFNLTLTVDTVAEGRANASARTSIIERLVNDISKDSPDGFITLMEILNDRSAEPVYPEVRLLQQWQNMAILDTPMDNYYVADLYFSKERSGATLAPSEISHLSTIVNTNVVHPWPAGFNAPGTSSAVVAATTTPVSAPAPVSDPTPVSNPTPGSNPAVLDSALVVTPVADSTATQPTAVVVDFTAPVVSAPRTPVAAYREQRGMVEDVALVNGVAILSGKDWRGMKMPRNETLLIADFDFSTVAREGVGRAAYLLVGPTSSDDVRIEIKSQSTSGSAGDKLPTSLLRLVNAAKSQSYGSAVVGVVGLQFFTPEALALAREVAGRSSRVRLVEGAENFVDVLQQTVTVVKARHAALVVASPEKDVALASTPQLE